MRSAAFQRNGERYDDFAQSGFFTLVRQETDRDTREEVCVILAKLFSLD
ncbi:MAG: hypothetical protein KBI35_02360 [Ruminococcus sp.]|nr:hypothetical protein [Ruminococcus sp.]